MYGILGSVYFVSMETPGPDSQAARDLAAGLAQQSKNLPLTSLLGAAYSLQGSTQPLFSAPMRYNPSSNIIDKVGIGNYDLGENPLGSLRAQPDISLPYAINADPRRRQMAAASSAYGLNLPAGADYFVH